VLTLGISLASVGVVLVSALFTFTANNTANTFSTGKVHLTLNPATATFTSPTMAPGDTVNANINVLNDGSLALRYAITGTTTASSTGGVTDTTTANTLAAALQLTIRQGVSSANCALGDYTGGRIEYGPAALSGLAALNLVGDPTTGQNGTVGAAGADRVLAAAATENLCFTVGLPSDDTASSGLGTTVTWSFVAEQTVNNA
jgi:hypothetical protein